jgi:SAM-dependent MidA family methyltransferase
MLDALAPIVRRGYVLLVDYGVIEGSAGPVHGYREHRRIADVLSDPGATDVTAGVDIAAVGEHARSLGFRTFEPVTQSAALSALGHARWERTMREMQSTLQASGRHEDAVRVWETRSRASLLTEPSVFGGFWWLVLATAGLDEPAWLARARGRSSD